MVVKRIVFDISAPSVGPVQAFYADLFDLDVAMDHGWIVTLSSGQTAPVHLSARKTTGPHNHL